MAFQAGIVGVGLTESTSPQKQMSPKLERCGTAVRRALGHAGLGQEQVDAVVFGALDGFEAVNLPGKHMGGAIGSSLGAPLFQVNTGGSTGGNLVNLARNLVSSGDFETVLCVGPPSFDGPEDIQLVLNTASPPMFEQPLGVGAVHMGAFYCTAYTERHGATEEDYALVAVKNYENARHNPYAHLRQELSVQDVLESRLVTTPLRFRTTCPVSSGATALIVASDRVAERAANPPVWLRAAGSIADTYLAGGRRDFSRFDTLNILAERMYRRAGISDPGSELDVIELFSPYVPFELMEMEAIGLCGTGEAVELVREGITQFEGDMPVNVSGGVLCSNSGVAGQLAPYCYTALQLMGQAPGGRQVADARRGVAHSTGGNVFQFHTFGILEAD